MTLPARYHNLAILIVLVVMCAIVIPRGESDDAYSIDGVSLGMTEAEVQEQWGEVERRDLDDELLVFSIAVASVDRPKAEAWLDGGMVRSVSGRRLFKGTQLLLDPNSTFEQAQELGQPAEIQAPPNGERGIWREGHRELDSHLVKFVAWNHETLKEELGADYKKFLTENPEAKELVIISLSKLPQAPTRK